MKHRFLLDLNIIYHAVLGVDRHNDPDLTCTELLLLIGKNCHKIVINGFLTGEYLARLYALQRAKAPALQPIEFINQLLFKAEKFSQETDEPIPIPDGVEVPQEDIQIVRSALVSRPILVSADEPLCAAVTANAGLLGLRAVSPAVALELARDS